MCGVYGGHIGAIRTDASDVLKHRGPDQFGEVRLVDGRERPFQFGSTRLNIVCGENIVLPMQIGGATIAYNGEVYNWRELRAELEKLGAVFQTRTDIEVVLQAYLHWGSDCLSKFNGMFAFAIWRNGKVFFARDRLGKKPLYFYRDTKDFAFSSEIKGFGRIRQRESADYHDYMRAYRTDTPYVDIFELPPGHFAHLDTATMALEIEAWWTFPEYKGDITKLDDAAEEFISLFRSACETRLLSEAPVTGFLSGGIDSTLIQTVCKFPKTYTVQFDELSETIDEASLVETFSQAVGFDAEILRPTKQDLHDKIDAIAYHAEFPLGSTVLPLFMLSERVRADGYKVVLSGEGSDELFNGYYRNELLLEEEDIVQRHLAGPYSNLASSYYGHPATRAARMFARGNEQNVEFFEDVCTKRWVEDAPLAHNLANVEATAFLPEKLMMADRMSMASGVELRNPFLDHRIVDFSVRLAPNLRWLDGKGKAVLRRALEMLGGDAVRPIVERPFKHGLPAPINAWFFETGGFDRQGWESLMIRNIVKHLHSARTSVPEISKSVQA